MNKALKCVTNPIMVNVAFTDGSIPEVTLNVDKSLIAPGKMEYLENGFFSPDTMVPDVYRYMAYIINGKLTLGQHIDTAVPCTRFFDHKASSYPESIVLLLESPHSDEYCYRNDVMYPIAPAQSKTGDNLHLFIGNYIAQAIKTFGIKDGFYPIIIVNPIQWQISLDYVLKKRGKMNKSVKEEVWHKLWDVPGVKEHFKKRLVSYIPRLLINACTGGRFSNNDPNSTALNYVVYKYLHDLKYSIIVNTYHPSAPSFCCMDSVGHPKNYWVVK